MIYRRAGYRCEACGAQRDPDARRWLEAHERWTYLRLQPGDRLVQKLIRLVALCTSCHRTTHFGHAQVTGHEQDALEHLCHVNDWTHQQAWEHVDAAFSTWQRRSEYVWELDLSMLTAVGVTVPPPPAAGERPAHAVAALDELAAYDRPRAAREQGERAPERDPGVAVRTVTMDEVGRGEDPMSRVLRGLPPSPI